MNIYISSSVKVLFMSRGSKCEKKNNNKNVINYKIKHAESTNSNQHQVIINNKTKFHTDCLPVF